MTSRYLGQRGGRLQTLMTWGIIAPAYTLFGYNNAVAGGLLDLPAWIQQFPQINTLTTTGAQEEHNSTLQGAVVSFYTLGCFFGSLGCLAFGDRLGRKRTIMLGAGVDVIGALIQASSYSLGQLIAGRLVAGFGLGALSATAPNWQTECAGAAHRGALVMLEGVFIGIGLSTAAWVNFGMSHVAGDAAWRFSLALPAVFALIVMAIMPWLPESPRWLLKHGHADEARQVLSALRDTDEHSEEINFVMAEMQTSLAIASEAKITELFRNGPQRLLHRTLLAVTCQMFQMLVGVNAIAFYLAVIFQQDLHLSPRNAAILSACFFMTLAISAPLGVATVERFGRRKLMLFSCTGMGIVLAIVSGILSRQNDHGADLAAVVLIFVYNVLLAVGWLGLPFLFCAELAPLSHRVSITAISTSSTWLWAFVVALITPVGLDNLGNRYYIIYAVFNLCMVLPTVYFFFPETSGRSLEEVDEIFLSSKSIFDTVRVSAEARTHRPLKEAGSTADQEKNLTVREEGQHLETVS